jgi:hypothetical protein
MDRRLFPKLPAPDAEFYGSEYRCGKDEAKNRAKRDGEYGPEYLEV